jgi:hypothetical protein
MAKLERDKQSMLLKQIFRVDQSFEAQPTAAPAEKLTQKIKK